MILRKKKQSTEYTICLQFLLHIFETNSRSLRNSPHIFSGPYIPVLFSMFPKFIDLEIDKLFFE